VLKKLLKGSKHTKESIQKMRQSHKGCKAWNKGYTKETHLSVLKISKTLTGKKHSLEHRRKNSKAKQGHIPWNKGLSKDIDKRVRKYAKNLKNKKKTVEHRIKLSKSKIKFLKNLTPKERLKLKQKNSRWHVDRWQNLTEEEKEECNQKNREGQLKYWSNLTTKEKEYRIRKSRSVMAIKPNKPEQFLIKFFEKNNLPYDYCGDHPYPGLGGKCPDFVHQVNSKIIELYGDYYHDGDNPQDRVDYYKKFGYNTLVIWEHELRDKDSLIEKILNFDNS
jgi:hypothetical protein